MSNLTAIATNLGEEILKIADGEKFELLSNKGIDGLPLVAWKLKKKELYDGTPSPRRSSSSYSFRFAEFAIARSLRQRGWIVPACLSFPSAIASSTDVAEQTRWRRTRSR